MARSPLSRPLSAAAAALLLPVIANSMPAIASSPPQHWVQMRSWGGAPEGKPVPTNVVPRVVYKVMAAYCLPDPQLTLREVDSGDAVDVDLTVNGPALYGQIEYVLDPVGPLAPETKYEVLHALDPEPQNGAHYCAEGPVNVVLTFTTGTGPDHVAPHIPGPESLSTSTSKQESCEGPGCGLPYRALGLTGWAPEPLDNPGDRSFFQVHDVRTGRLVIALRYPPSKNLTQVGIGEWLCFADSHPARLRTALDQFGQVRWRVTAVDRAGNRSKPVYIEHDDDCREYAEAAREWGCDDWEETSFAPDEKEYCGPTSLARAVECLEE